MNALIALLLAAPLFAQTPQIEISASTTTAQLAVPAALTAKLIFPQTDALTLNLEASTTQTYAITKVDAGPLAQSGGQAGQTLNIQILPLAVGKIDVRLVWDQKDSAGRVLRAEAPVFFLYVADPQLPPTADIQDIKPPVSARWPLWPFLLLAVAAAAAYRFWRRNQNAGVDGPSAAVLDIRPPDAAALEDLEALRASNLWNEGRYKEFYIRLTDVVRVYLERRFDIPATRLTTSELSRQLRQAELDREVFSAIKDVFDRADLVKFARVRPEQEWGGLDIERCTETVRLTAPKSAVPAEAKA